MSEWARDYTTPNGDPRKECVALWAVYKNGDEKLLRTTLIAAVSEMREKSKDIMPGITDEHTDLEFLAWGINTDAVKNRLGIERYELRKAKF